MNWVLVIFTLCATYKTLEAGSSSTMGSGPCVQTALNLHDFKDSMLTFLDAVLPLYIDISNDLNDKVAEFQLMKGVQQFLSTPAAYGQYIQLYSNWNQAYVTQANTINGMTQSTPSASNAKTSVIFCQSDIVTMVQALDMFAKGTAQARSATVKTVAAFVQSTDDSGFTPSPTSLQYLSSDAVKISNALDNINVGLQAAIYAADMLIETINSTYQYQKSNTAITYLQNFAEFKGKLQDNMNSMLSKNNLINSAFFSPTSAAYTMYDLDFQPYYSVFNSAQKKIAKYFDNIVTAGDLLTNQIVGVKGSSY